MNKIATILPLILSLLAWELSGAFCLLQTQEDSKQNTPDNPCSKSEENKEELRDDDSLVDDLAIQSTEKDNFAPWFAAYFVTGERAPTNIFVVKLSNGSRAPPVAAS